MAYYTITINEKNNQISSANNTIDSLNANIANFRSQILNLQSQIDKLGAPNIIEINMNSKDIRPLFGTPYLHVDGEVYNSGINTGYNCSLHVTAYQKNEVLAINTDIMLGTIKGQSYALVNASLTYSGGSLIGWVIIPSPTIIPAV